MDKLFKFAFGFTFLCFLLTANSARADVVHVEFTGTVEFAFDNSPSSGSGDLFGEVVSIGQTVTGGFSYDTDLPGVETYAGQERYLPAAPLMFSVQMGDTVFSTDDTFYLSIGNDYDSPADDEFGLHDTTDHIVIVDGEDDFPQTNVGDTILVNGVTTTGFLSWRIFDSQSNTLDSTDLPQDFSLVGFEFTEGEVSGTNANGIYALARYRIDSINVFSVPEPMHGSALLLFAFHAAVRRRRT